MLGRSDATLNPNGVRFGSSELYRISMVYPFILTGVAYHISMYVCTIFVT